MNHFLLPKTKRLKEWRDFRKALNKDMTDKEQIVAVNNWWALCPLSTRIIDPYDPNQWPSGWELLYNGDFCRSSIALGMEQTFLQRNGRWDYNRVKLLLIDDNKEDIYLVTMIDNTWILNYHYNKIFDINNFNKVQILQTYQYTGRNHITI